MAESSSWQCTVALLLIKHLVLSKFGDCTMRATKDQVFADLRRIQISLVEKTV